MARRKKSTQKVVETSVVETEEVRKTPDIVSDGLIEVTPEELEKPVENDGIVKEEPEEKTKPKPKQVSHKSKSRNRWVGLSFDPSKGAEIINASTGAIIGRPKTSVITLRSGQLLKIYFDKEVKPGQVVIVSPAYDTKLTIFNINYEKGYAILATSGAPIVQIDSQKYPFITYV